MCLYDFMIWFVFISYKSIFLNSDLKSCFYLCLWAHQGESKQFLQQCVGQKTS